MKYVGAHEKQFSEGNRGEEYELGIILVDTLAGFAYAYCQTQSVTERY